MKWIRVPRSRAGRVLVGFFLAALVLLVLSPIVALQVPAIRRQVQRWAESQLTLAVGRLVHVEHITLYPWKARLDLHQVRVASGQSLADGSLLTAESVHLGWSWRALLSRSLLFEQVVLVRPHVTLPTEGVSTAASGVVLPPLPLGNRSIILDGWRIDIQSVTIENGQVTWEGNGSKESLDGLQGLIGLRRTPDGRASVIGNLSASRLLLPPGGPLKEIAGISIQADGDAQALTIASAEGLLAGARITAQGRILDPAGAAQCDLHLVLSSPLDALLKSAGFSTHVEGQLTAEGRLQGPWAHLAFQGKGSAQVSNAPARSNLIPFDLRWSNGRLEVDTSQADRPESLHAKLVIEPATGAFRARLKVGEADLDDLAGLPALVTQLVGLTLPAELGGTLTADLDLTGRGVDLTTLRGAGTIRVDDLSVGAGLPSGRLEARVVATTSRLALETFALDVPGAVVQGKGSLGFPDGRLDIPLQADIRSVAAFSRGFGLPLLGGKATLAGRLTGTRETPRFQGHITWQDPHFGMRAFDQIEGDVEWMPRVLRSSRLTVRLGKTVATLQGSVNAPGTTPFRQLDLRRDLVLDLQGQVNPGRTADLAQFLPAGLEVQGTFRASGRIAGSPHAPTGEVEVAFTTLQTWEEKWQRGDALLRLVPDALQIARLTLRRGSESVTGDIRIASDGALQGQLSSTSLDLARLAILSGSEVAGRTGLQLDIQGTLKEPRAHGKATATVLLFRNVPLGAGAASFTIDRKNFDLDLALGGGSQRLRLNIGLPPDRTLRLDLALADADLTQLLKLADIGSLTLSQARGTGRILVRSPADDYADAEGEATLTALRLVLEGEVWESRDPLELAWRGRTVMVRRARFRSADREVEIHGRLEDGGQTDLQVSGQLPFAALSSRLPHMKPTGGMVTADIRVRGSLSTPEYEGILQLAGGSLTLPGIPVPLQNVRGTTELQAGRALIRELRGEIAGGSLQGTGEASWRANDWGFQFVFQEDNGRAEQLLAGVYTDKSGVTGSLSVGGTLSGRGRGEEDFFSNLKGDLKLAMRDGRMGRQALATRILSLINIGQLFDTGGLEIASQGLPYHRLTADVIIEQGAARTENLLFESRAFNMSAVGQVNFVEDTIEMDIAVKPFQNVDKFLGILPLPGQLSGGKENSLVAAFYHVSGTLKDPKVTPLPMKSLGRNTIGVFRRLLFIPDALPGQ